jgi:ABC-type Fe3+-hydroxamate transport system substrate-binding protein
MRTTLLLITVAVLFSACADDQHSTAPASRTAGSRSASGNVTASAQNAGSPQAKPIDQVGFTTITEAVSTNMVIPTGGQDTRIAVCPAGSVVTGGGFRFIGYNSAGGTPPWITNSARNAPLGGQTGWQVSIDNEQPGATDGIIVQVFAYCAS